MAVLLMGAAGAVADSNQKAGVIPAEDYALYDQVVTSKFLTSATQLVVIARMTRLRPAPDQKGAGMSEAFQELGHFEGELPPDLIREFNSVNQRPRRLEGQFHFAVRCRFTTGETIEEPEMSLARPVTVARARPVQAPSVPDRLAFSGLAETFATIIPDVCRSPTSRRHRSGIPRVVSPPRTKLDVA